MMGSIALRVSLTTHINRRASPTAIMTQRADEVWKNAALVRTFVDGVRGGIPFAAEQIEIMLRLIDARAAAVDRVADLGCGSGVLARSIRARYPQARCTLVDFSEPMLAEARVSFGDDPRVHFVSADLGRPDWTGGVRADAPFDVVVSGYAIHHLPDQRKRDLYGEIFSLLAPGGVFLNVEHVASHTPWIETIADDLMIDSLHAFHARQGTPKDRVQVADEFVHRPDKAANILAPVEIQCEWLRACGFDDVDCYFKVFELAVFGGRRPA
ncbi:MAG: class I SAM-dependent methyltransferase [Candidatus Binatia bacterium]